jgi:hypothetical protein
MARNDPLQTFAKLPLCASQPLYLLIADTEQ